ncbi:MAG: CdaR family protein [Vicinamibacterales bacterium]
MAPFPFRNFGLKFLSVSIAVLLWLVVGGEGVVERVMRAPVEYQNLPAGLELVGSLPETVEVRVRGSSGALGRLVAGDMSIVLDLRTVQPGLRVFNLLPGQVRSPFGVDAVQVSPSSVTVVFEAAGVRSVPVKAEVLGRPAPGFEVTDVMVEPKNVELAGPVGALDEVNSATTEAVSIANATKTVRQTVAIGVESPNVRLRVPHSAVVTVTIERSKRP